MFLTGGGTGLGKSMALRFAELGARMFLVGRREDPLRETCEEIHRTGGSAAYTTCDVRDYGAVEAAAAKAEDQFGKTTRWATNPAEISRHATKNRTPNPSNSAPGTCRTG